MPSAAGTMESSLSKTNLDNRYRNKDGEISGEREKYAHRHVA
jgi:hypothetical protein